MLSFGKKATSNFVRVNIDVLSYYRVVSVGRLNFDCCSYCGHSRLVSITFPLLLLLPTPPPPTPSDVLVKDGRREDYIRESHALKKLNFRFQICEVLRVCKE